MGHYPYKVEKLLTRDDGTDVWWPVSSCNTDSMVIGDGIPGDKKSAELMARCCRIAYGHALEDASALMLARGVDISALVRELLGNTVIVYCENDNGIWLSTSTMARLRYGVYAGIEQWYITGVDGTLAQLGQAIPRNIVDVIEAADARREEFMRTGGVECQKT